MDIKKISIKLTGILIVGISVFFFINSEKVEDNILRTDINEIIELMNISDKIISIDKNTKEEVANHIENNKQDKKESKETKIPTKEIHEVYMSKEEKVEETNKSAPDKKLASTSNRGQTIEKEEKVDLFSKSLNKYVLDIISTYSLEEGNYPYLLNNDFENYNGVTEDIYYKGELILKANPNGNKASHCTGITFEVFFKAMRRRNKELGIPVDDFNGMTKDELFDMALTWFVAKGPKSESNLAVALEKYGLGTRINNLEEVRPGDFIDLSRENNSGHAVVFMDWIREGSKIIGLKFWSSQGSTNGISYKEEYFNIRDNNGKKYGGVIKDNLHIVRVNPVNEYK